MTTNNIIKHLYAALAETKVADGFFVDSSWEGVNRVEKQLVESLDNIGLQRDQVLYIAFVSSEYVGNVGEQGHGKVFSYAVLDDEYKSIIKIDIVCTFCGTVNNPMGRYDITVLMNAI